MVKAIKKRVRNTETDGASSCNSLPKRRKSSPSNYLPKETKRSTRNHKCRPKFIGTLVAKCFDRIGTVKAFKDGQYHIEYDDGDEEHCDFERLMELICEYEKSQEVLVPDELVSISTETPKYQEGDVLEKVPAKHKERAIAALASLSKGWIPVPYQSKKEGIKVELHFKTPHHGVIFRSHSSALSFDKILKHSKDESSALESFIKDLKGGYDDFQSLTLSCGNYTRERPSYSKLMASGWKKIRVKESKGQMNHHWLSPDHEIEFRYLKAAEDFEILRIKFNGDEVEAGKQYAKKLKGKKISHYVKGGMKGLKGGRIMRIEHI